MISIDEVIGIHAILIENFGGTTGLRNRELLESALARPVQTSDSNKVQIFVFKIGYQAVGPQKNTGRDI